MNRHKLDDLTARFNTQPPEGGWSGVSPMATISRGFNTQPPEGGWICIGKPSEQ